MNNQQETSAPAYRAPSSTESHPSINQVDPGLVPQDTVIRQSIKLPIVLMLCPLAAFLLCVLLYAVIAIAFAQPTSGGDDSFSGGASVRVVINTMLFSAGALSVIVAPISFLTGLVMLISRLAAHKTQ